MPVLETCNEHRIPDPGTKGLRDGPSAKTGNQVITVAHLIGRWGIGGLEGQLTELLNRLPPDRFRHHVIFRNGRHAVAPPVRDGVDVICLDHPPRDPRWPLRLARLLARLDVSVVHNRELFTVHDTVAACRLARVSRMAFSFHGFTDTATVPNGPARWLWRRALRRYGARWAVSAAARDAVAEALGVPADTFSVLPNGVDLERFQPAHGTHARRRLGLPLDRVVVLAVGNVTAVKNHRLVLDGLRAASVPAGAYTLAVVGEDRLDGALRRRAAERLPGHDVRWVGPVAEVTDWYRAADVFVLPSRSEGLCNALLEAMACGLSVLATRVQGNREVVEHETSGLLASIDDAVAFGTALRRLVTDADLRERLGRAARRHMTAQFDIRHTVERYARAYAGLCAR